MKPSSPRSNSARPRRGAATADEALLRQGWAPSAALQRGAFGPTTGGEQKIRPARVMRNWQRVAAMLPHARAAHLGMADVLGDAHDLDNQRGITLLDVIMKILSHTALRRIRKHNANIGWLSNYQFCRPGRGCEEALI